MSDNHTQDQRKTWMTLLVSCGIVFLLLQLEGLSGVAKMLWSVAVIFCMICSSLSVAKLAVYSQLKTETKNPLLLAVHDTLISTLNQLPPPPVGVKTHALEWRRLPEDNGALAVERYSTHYSCIHMHDEFESYDISDSSETRLRTARRYYVPVSMLHGPATITEQVKRVTLTRNKVNSGRTTTSIDAIMESCSAQPATYTQLWDLLDLVKHSATLAD